MRTRSLVLDIGGEGRHARAWNVNPSPVRTVGPRRGEPIPRRIAGRADRLPLPDGCAAVIIVERTPLRAAALAEIARVAAPRARILLRHARPHGLDPHALVKQWWGGAGEWSQQWIELDGRPVQQTLLVLDRPPT